MYGGYCFFNNAAIAAEAITEPTGERVAILDVDYHHGNGSQQIFWRRGDVRYVSIHADPERAYPYFLGRADETGEGDGAGENLNIPLRAGATNADYLEATDQAVAAIAAVPGSVVVVSLGFDTYGLDPIGDFALTTDAYHEVGRRVAASAGDWSSSRRAATTARRWARTPVPGCVAPRVALRTAAGGGLHPNRGTCRLIAALDQVGLEARGRRARRPEMPTWPPSSNGTGPPPLWDRPAGFGTLVHIILEQQVSLASARAAFDRLVVATDP